MVALAVTLRPLVVVLPLTANVDNVPRLVMVGWLAVAMVPIKLAPVILPITLTVVPVRLVALTLPLVMLPLTLALAAETAPVTLALVPVITPP